MRVESDRRTRDGRGWIHFFEVLIAPPALPQGRPLPPKPATVERASIESRHVAYTALLQALMLSDDHCTALLSRGLSHAEIERLQFKTTLGHGPEAEIARELSQQFDLRGLPGFYEVAGNCRMVSIAPGFFVPYRDELGRIEGLQIRRWPHAGEGKYLWLSSNGRLGGVSSGAPLHYTRPDLLSESDEVWLTEGALKAEVASFLLGGAPMIAAAGVTLFHQEFPSTLRAKYPKLKTAVIAFDSDWRTKPPVRSALDKLIRELGRAGFRVIVRTWPPGAGKGIDDYLLSLHGKGKATVA
jgi:hypothetical protein